MSKVADIMFMETYSVSPSTPVIEVAHQMKVSGRNAIPVCEDGVLHGLVTERDIVVGIVARASDPVTEPISSVLNRRQPTVSPDTDIEQAIKVMQDNGMCTLAVTQNGKLFGLLTLESLAWASLTIATPVLPQNRKLTESKEVKEASKI